MDENIVEDKFRAAVNIIQHFPKNGNISSFFEFGYDDPI